MRLLFSILILTITTSQSLWASDQNSIADNDPRLTYFTEYGNPMVEAKFREYMDPDEAAVVWDVNGTITGWRNEGEGACAILQEKNFNNPKMFPLLHEVFHESGVIDEDLWPYLREGIFGKLYSTRYQFLQDSKIPELVQLCPNSFGATKYRSCQYGPIKSTHRWRDERLRNLGVQFKYTFDKNYLTPNTDGSFPLDLIQDNMRPPIYYKGMIMVDRHKKGPTVLNLFHKTRFTPKKILIVEDSLDNAKEMIATFARAGIDAHALIYTGNKEDRSFNGPMFKYQFEKLFKEKIWVPDAEAEKLFPLIPGQ